MKLYWGYAWTTSWDYVTRNVEDSADFCLTRSELAGGVVEENLRNEFAMSLRFRWSFGLFPSCEVIV